MVVYLKSFTREEATFCLFNEETGQVEKTKTVSGDLSEFAFGVPNTNDFRLWSNGAEAHEIDGWHYPVPCHLHKQGKRELEIIKRFSPFSDFYTSKDLTHED